MAIVEFLFVLARLVILVHAQTRATLCISSGALPEGELGRLWPTMKAVITLSGREGSLTNLPASGSEQYPPEDQASAEKDLQSCAATLANVTALERNLLRFVVSENMIESLDAVRRTLSEADSLVDNSTFCTNKVSDFNQTGCCHCRRETAYCQEWRREANAQQWKAENAERSLNEISNGLKSFPSWTIEDLDSPLNDASGTGSGSDFSGSTSEPPQTSSFAKKLDKLNALLTKADNLVSNVTTTSGFLNLWQRNLTCGPASRQTEAASREELLKKRKMVALFRVSQALAKLRRACKLHSVATSLKGVIQRVQNIENWWCNQTGFVDCTSEDRSMSSVESGMQTMICSVMLVQSRSSQICQGSADVSCCGHLGSLQELANVGSFSSIASVNHHMFATGLIEELHRSCKNGVHSLKANATQNSTCYDLQHQGTHRSTCSKQEIRLRFSCPFPFVSTSFQSHWDAEARSQFKTILQHALRRVYELNETSVSEENTSSTIFPCAKTCDPRAQGIPPLIYQSFRFVDVLVHHIWLCVFLRAVYVLYINWYKMTGSQPHRSLLLCNFSFALATITRLVTFYYAGINSPNCRSDGSFLAGQFEDFRSPSSSASIYFCPFSGTINLIALLMLCVGLFWAFLIWTLIVGDMVNCRCTDASLHIGKPLFQRLRDDKRFRLEVMFILGSFATAAGITQIVIDTSTTFVSHPLLNLCMLDNWPYAYVVILFVFCFPAGGLLIRLHYRIEAAFSRSDGKKGLHFLTMNQSNERIRWYGRRLRIYGASTLIFASISLVFVTSGLVQQITNSNQREKLSKFLLCNFAQSTDQVCPEYTWPGVLAQYGLYWFVQLQCLYNIMLLSWCWQENLKQPANLVLALLKDKGSRLQSSW